MKLCPVFHTYRQIYTEFVRAYIYRMKVYLVIVDFIKIGTINATLNSQT